MPAGGRQNFAHSAHIRDTDRHTENARKRECHIDPVYSLPTSTLFIQLLPAASIGIGSVAFLSLSFPSLVSSLVTRHIELAFLTSVTFNFFTIPHDASNEFTHVFQRHMRYVPSKIFFPEPHSIDWISHANPSIATIVFHIGCIRKYRKYAEARLRKCFGSG